MWLAKDFVLLTSQISASCANFWKQEWCVKFEFEGCAPLASPVQLLDIEQLTMHWQSQWHPIFSPDRPGVINLLPLASEFRFEGSLFIRDHQ